ncbi:MAG: TIGR01777 family oxidoreductase [Candidatus Kapaibacterium sp.]
MKILISGSTGFIGSKLVALLQTSGHSVTRLVRSSSDIGLLWDPYKNEVDISRMEGYDVFVHLSGESINGRWTQSKKKRIMESRIIPTHFLAECISKLKNPPKAFICSSAIGYYGNRGDEELTEASSPGTGFLADVCKVWEAATQPIAKQGIRVVNVRTGLVLSPDGGALQKLLLPFKLGAGGKIGSGNQWWSWITLNDLLKIYQYSIEDGSVNGPVNAVAPNPERNSKFVKTLGKVLRRPAIFPLPSIAVRTIFGEMGQELLLDGQRVVPKKLIDSGFQFEHTELEPALRCIIV